jgi:ribosomal protein S27AE
MGTLPLLTASKASQEGCSHCGGSLLVNDSGGQPIAFCGRCGFPFVVRSKVNTCSRVTIGGRKFRLVPAKHQRPSMSNHAGL